MKHIFIINPIAGKGRSLELIPFIEECFKDKAEEFIIRVTDYPGHATEIAKEYSTVGKCKIYSVGGDGTVNEIVNGIAGTESSLGVIPTGSGNDFLRSFQSKGDIEAMIINTINGQEKCIDLAKVNDKYFINISSIGFDADVVFNADKFKKVPGITGSMAYLISIVYTVFKKKICNVKIDIDGKKLELKLLLAAVANGKYYGGGIIPTPDAKIDDGLFDICLVTEMSRIQILRLFPKYVKGLHAQLKQVSFYRGKKISIQSEEDLCLNIDGEILTAQVMIFEILENAIKVIFPVGEGATTLAAADTGIGLERAS
ncbi:MAG: diacylglycerol/lipid kinase family protein, partial [Ruminiclostridium sp.]